MIVSHICLPAQTLAEFPRIFSPGLQVLRKTHSSSDIWSYSNSTHAAFGSSIRTSSFLSVLYPFSTGCPFAWQFSQCFMATRHHLQCCLTHVSVSVEKVEAGLHHHRVELWFITVLPLLRHPKPFLRDDLEILTSLIKPNKLCMPIHTRARTFSI